MIFVMIILEIENGRNHLNDVLIDIEFKFNIKNYHILCMLIIILI